MTNGFKVCQFNVGKRDAALDELSLRIKGEEISVVLLTEPPNRKEFLGGASNFRFIVKNIENCPTGVMYEHLSGDGPNRASIWVEKSLAQTLKCTLMHQFCNRDIVTISLQIPSTNGRTEKLLLSSVYMPTLDKDNKIIQEPFNETCKNLCKFAEDNKWALIIGTDSNSHSGAWGCYQDDGRGFSLAEECINQKLDVLNVGNTPTFDIGGRSSIIDLTLANGKASRMVEGWTVDPRMSFSDHKMITFRINKGMEIVNSFNDKKSTNWKAYRESLKESLPPIRGEISSVSELEIFVSAVTKAMVESQLKSSRKNGMRCAKEKSWYNEKLEKLRIKLVSLDRRTRRAKKKDRNYLASLEDERRLLKKTYEKERAIARKKAWVKYTETIEETNDAARLQKVLEKCKTNDIGTIIKDDGSFTKDKEESLEFLIKKHFPGACGVSNRMATDYLAPVWTDEELKIVDLVVNKERITEVVSNLGKWKACGNDEIHPIYIQQGLEILMEHLIRMFKASLLLNYIPCNWLKCNVLFIPKPGKDSSKWDGQRCISLINHLPKILEKLIDIRMREVELVAKPLHEAQKGFMANASIDNALHESTGFIENAFRNNKEVIGLYVDFSMAFNLISFECIERAMEKFNVPKMLREWLARFLRNRNLKARDSQNNEHFICARAFLKGRLQLLPYSSWLLTSS